MSTPEAPTAEPFNQEQVTKRESKRASLVSRASQALVEALNTDHVKPAKDDKGKKALERHDPLNLVFLPAIVICIFLNLDFANEPWTQFWYKGDYFWWLFYVTLAYFVIDTIWIIVDPACVKSPPLIILHHAATTAYLLIPVFVLSTRWLMCALLFVETNTFFLILRRYHNREHKTRWAPGTPLWLSLLDAFVQGSFYFTWVLIRCILYPLYLPLIILTYINYSQNEAGGNYFNVLLITPVFQMLFVWMNYTWSVDLFCPKPKEGSTGDAEENHDL